MAAGRVAEAAAHPMARRPRSFYRGMSFRPPEPVAAAARRALERRAQQPPSNRSMTPLGQCCLPTDGCSGASSSTSNQSTSPPLKREPLKLMHNQAHPPAQKTCMSNTHHPSKGEKATRKKLKILLVVRVSKSAPCNSLESGAAPHRRTQTRGVFPLFQVAAQGASEFFQVLGNPPS